MKNTTIMATAQNRLPSLNAMQIHLLRFFSERTPDEQEIADIQRLISTYYAQKADKEMEKIWQEKQFDDQKLLAILNTHLE